MRDLVEYTGVAHAGLYSAFGDKEELFKAAIRKYCNEVVGKMFGILERSNAGRTKIESILKTIILMNKDGRLRNGCMSVNTVVEFAGTDTELKEIVLSNFKKLEKALSRALNNAVAAGEVRNDSSSQEDSHFNGNNNP